MNADAVRTRAGGDSEERSAAIGRLVTDADDSTVAYLQALHDGDVRMEAERSLRAVQSRLSAGERIGQVFSGISLGSILLLAALGLAITYGLMGVINMAHGELHGSAYAADRYLDVWNAFGDRRPCSLRAVADRQRSRVG